jgi:uncharacterized protein YdaT
MASELAEALMSAGYDSHTAITMATAHAMSSIEIKE